MTSHTLQIEKCAPDDAGIDEINPDVRTSNQTDQIDQHAAAKIGKIETDSIDDKLEMVQRALDKFETRRVGGKIELGDQVMAKKLLNDLIEIDESASEELEMTIRASEKMDYKREAGVHSRLKFDVGKRGSVKSELCKPTSDKHELRKRASVQITLFKPPNDATEVDKRPSVQIGLSKPPPIDENERTDVGNAQNVENEQSVAPSPSEETKTRKSWLRVQQPYDALLKKYKIDPTEQCDCWGKDSDTCSCLSDVSAASKPGPVRGVRGVQCLKARNGAPNKPCKSKKAERVSKKKMLKSKLTHRQMKTRHACDYDALFGESQAMWHPSHRIAYNFLRLNGMRLKGCEADHDQFKSKQTGQWISNVFNFDKPLVKVGLRCRPSKYTRNPITWEEVENDEKQSGKRTKLKTPLFDMTVSDRLYLRPAVKCRQNEIIRNPITWEEVNFTRPN